MNPQLVACSGMINTTSVTDMASGSMGAGGFLSSLLQNTARSRGE